MKDEACIYFLQWALPHMQLRCQGFRRVRKQVCKRVGRRIAALGLADELAYRDYLHSHAVEWQTLGMLCRVTISRFYRDKSVFNQLGSELVPRLCDQLRLQGGKSLRCWSAGCARGEETYSLVLLWSFMLQDQYPEIAISINATDIDPVMIQQARKACYAFSSLKNLLPEWRQIAFTKIDDQYCLHNAYQRPVNFSLGDVENVVNTQSCHLVLCRNLVFTYFNVERQEQFLHRLQEQLTEGGVLVLGTHEHLPEGVSGWCQWRQRLPIYIRE
jgi:chemotaxis protein methyltransferase CheR